LSWAGRCFDLLIVEQEDEIAFEDEEASSSLSCTCGGATTPGGHSSTKVVDRPFVVASADRKRQYVPTFQNAGASSVSSPWSPTAG